MQVELVAEDWLMSMGMVGLKRLFEDEVQFTDYGISFDHKIIEQIPERYYSYLLKIYDIAQRDKKYMEEELEKANKNPERFKDSIKNILKRMTDQKKKVDSYFSEPELEEIVAKAKSIKNIDEIDKLRQCIKEFIAITSQNHINEKLTFSNYVRSVVLNPLYGQVSFLNVTHNKKTTNEQLDIFRNDFIKPAILEIQWLEILNSEMDVKRIIQFLTDYKNYSPFNNWLRHIKKVKNLEEVKQFFMNEVPSCTFIDGMIGTMTFEEKIFNPLGTSLDNSYNFYWNLNQNNPIPISALARLNIIFNSNRYG